MSRGVASLAYDEFEITLLPVDGRTFNTLARFGTKIASGSFESPVPPDQLARVRAGLTLGVLAKSAEAPGAVERGQRPLGPNAAAAMITWTPRSFGVELYQRLFTGDVLTLYENAKSSLGSRGNTGLRLRLRFSGSRKSEISRVMSLPWELLAPSEQTRPLVISTSSPLVRSFDGDENPVAPFTPPIRVLAIAASPDGQVKLDLAAEEQSMRDAWGSQPSVRFRFARGYLPDVQRALAEHQPHIVHFMGHGDLVGDEGVLLFEDAEKKEHKISADLLGTLFGEHPQLRLVFLNSCRGAEAGISTTSSPFAGVATRLVQENVPAVVAMQFPVSDNSALEFSREFYARLVNGMAIDSAVSEARHAVYMQGTGEWATPVLFLRPRDGALFHRAAVSAPEVLSDLRAANAIEVFEPTKSADHAEPFIVFVATTSGQNAGFVTFAINAMRNAGMTIVRPRPIPWDGYHETFGRLADACDLFLHVLGPHPGNQIEDRTEYHAVEQFNIGFDGARSQLVIFPPGTPKVSTDTVYNALLERVLACPREPARLQLIECTQEQVIAHILEHREILEAGSATGGEAQVYIEVHSRDREAAGALTNALAERGIRFALPPESAATTGESMTHFQQAVRSVPLMIVLAGVVDPAWVSQRLREGMKVAVDREPPTRLVVLRLPGNKEIPRMPYYAAAYGDENGYSPQTLDVILSALSS